MSDRSTRGRGCQGEVDLLGPKGTKSAKTKADLLEAHTLVHMHNGVICAALKCSKWDTKQVVRTHNLMLIFSGKCALLGAEREGGLQKLPTIADGKPATRTEKGTGSTLPKGKPSVKQNEFSQIDTQAINSWVELVRKSATAAAKQVRAAA